MRLPYQNGEPQVIVRLLSPHRKEWISFVAYVDSGATYSIFHEDVAELLGVDVKKGLKVWVTVGSGEKIPVFLHRLRVQFSGEEFVARVGFSPRLGVEVNLVGQRSFFDKFKICFDNKNKCLETTKL